MRRRQQEIINELGVQPTINPNAEFEARSRFLAHYLGETSARGFILGISGGQDSLLAGLIAQHAVELRRAEGQAAEFHAVLLPYGDQADRTDAVLAIETICPDVVHDINIKSATDAFARTYRAAEDAPLADYHKGNVKARMRMIAQYAIAGEHNLLVVGTDHAAEAVTGFFTKYGDGGADILPLSGLTKEQGRAILRTRGAPAVFITKQPTADLLDATPGQADETELGVPYHTLDAYLCGESVDTATAQTIEARFTATAHKREVPVAYIAPPFA